MWDFINTPIGTMISLLVKIWGHFFIGALGDCLVASCLELALCMNMLHVIMKLAYLVLEAKIVDWFCLADLDILDHEFCFVNSWWSIFFKTYWSGKLLIFTWTDLLLTPFYCLLVLTCHLNNCNCLFYFILK